jgi:hypothetical protein
LNTKGTWDIVELDDDINESVSEVMQVPITHLTNPEISELCLGFVAVSRHRHQLINCRFLGDLND